MKEIIDYMNTVVSYEEIRMSAPVRQKRAKKKRRIRAWQALLFFAIVMTCLLLFGGLVYLSTGNLYLESFAEQVFFLISSIVFVFLMRADLKEVFPVKKPKLLAVCGVLVLLLASFLAAEVFSILALQFAPEALEKASDNLSGLIEGPSLPVQLLLAAVCPAVCEEALHRGVLLNGFRNSFRDRRLMILFGGLLFGLFHIYPIRMIMPAFIGFLMCWLVIQTDNMLYGCLLHFGYNAILIWVSALSASAAGAEQEIADISLTPWVSGFYVLFPGIFIPFLIYLGTWMVRRVTSPRIPDFFGEKKERHALIWMIIATACILLFGALLLLGLF